MNHNDIFNTFKILFPMYSDWATEYFQNGRNSIRIRLQGIHQELIFTYNNNTEWKLETIKKFHEKQRR